MNLAIQSIPTQNLWERFGFKDNPFDTRALSLSPEASLSVSTAYIGQADRYSEHSLMRNFLRNPGGGCIIVEGDVGVGKTTFVNYHRYHWQIRKSNPLITPLSEISVERNWTPKDFLLSILGVLGGRLAVDCNRRQLQNDSLLNEIVAMTSVLLRRNRDFSGGV
ncbi:MAG: hypothetical protein KAX05_12585 [Bacteroidales bacterium]|nr:hypothetical protein [Bacteroidales bacterium]